MLEEEGGGDLRDFADDLVVFGGFLFLRGGGGGFDLVGFAGGKC